MLGKLIADYVNESCKAPGNAFTPSFYSDHILVVSRYADTLAGILGADREIVLYASYLHDISAVHDISTLPVHNVRSAEMATELLASHGYDIDRTKMVSGCIKNHMTPLPIGSATPEEICLSNADAISQIVVPSFWLYFMYSVRKQSYQDGKIWLQKKIDSNWNSLIEPARELIEEKYNIISRALSDEIYML
ncbi:MAG: HD domain-containing protein [Bacteroidota bacterium]